MLCDDGYEAVVWSYEFSEEQKEAAQEVIETDKPIPEFWRNKYKKELVRNWDLFYRRNTTNFFKDREWIRKEFPEFNEREGVMYDMGCGVGNSAFPILEGNPNLTIVAFDCSKNAIKMLNERKLEHPQGHRITEALVWDITKDEVPDHLVGGADLLLLMFVLSAIPPEAYATLGAKIKQMLKPGGMVAIRDYGRYDLAQVRFAKSKNQMIENNFYVRCDGTMAYYFTIEELRELFGADGTSMIEISNGYECKEFINRKREVQMKRVWIQAKFKKV